MRSSPFRLRASVAYVFLIFLCGVSGRAVAAERVVFQSGAEGYPIYRIPVIVRAENGDLLAFAEARSGGDASEIDIVMKRSSDLGATWSDLSIVVENDSYRGWDGLPTINVTAGNSTPVVDLLDPEYPGRIWLPFTIENKRVFVTYSDDNGQTWQSDAQGRATEITPDVKLDNWAWYATGPVHGIQLTRGENRGRLVIPSDHRIGSDNWGAHIVYSDDHGASWRLGAVDTLTAESPVHPNENTAVELVDGRIYVNARDQNGSSPATRAIAYSSDGGESFDASFVADPQLITPVVQNALLRFAAKDEGDARNILLLSGPGKSNSRSDMTVSVSFDEGTTWVKQTVVKPGPAAYSDLVKIDATKFGLLWEAGDSLYDQILFKSIDFGDLDPIAFNGIDGDVNQDRVVNIEDINAFASVWSPLGTHDFPGGAESYRNGDLNFDGVQNLADAAILRQAFLDADDPLIRSRIESTRVPEPGSLAITALSVAYLLITWAGQ